MKDTQISALLSSSSIFTYWHRISQFESVLILLSIVLWQEVIFDIMIGLPKHWPCLSKSEINKFMKWKRIFCSNAKLSCVWANPAKLDVKWKIEDFIFFFALNIFLPFLPSLHRNSYSLINPWNAFLSGEGQLLVDLFKHCLKSSKTDLIVKSNC